MKPQSAKAKGRKLQKWFTELLIERLKLDKDDLESRPMGSQGEDIIMGKESRTKFPYSIECKNVERLNVWDAYSQAEANCKTYEPLYSTNHSIRMNQHNFHLVVCKSLRTDVY